MRNLKRGFTIYICFVQFFSLLSNSFVTAESLFLQKPTNRQLGYQSQSTLDLQANNFIITQGECFIPNTYNIYGVDTSNSSALITYYLYSMQYLTVKISNTPTTTFTNSNIMFDSTYDIPVFFCHDNSTNTPTFDFYFGNEFEYSSYYSANISFSLQNSSNYATSNKETSNATTIIVAVTVSIGLFIIIGVIAIYSIYKYKKMKSKKHHPVLKKNSPMKIVKSPIKDRKSDDNIGFLPLLLSEIELEEKTGFHLPSSIKELLIEKPTIGIPYKEVQVFREKKLGVGGYGIVYKGLWNGKDIAVKELLINGEINKEIAEEFAKEIKVWYQLNHDYIIKLHGISICLTDNMYLMIMQIAENGSLDKLLKNKAENITWKLRMEIALDVINGIKYLHEIKIVHRDIKSGNVLIDGNFRAKISDFGVAKVKKEQQFTKSVGQVGTVTYMAPELFKVSTNYTNESDIYAFGIVLWELMENQKPGKKLKDVQEEDWEKTIERFKIEDREEISERSKNNHPKMCELIRECWKFEAKERPSEDKIIEILKNEAIDCQK